ncbi:hypothetical protein GCM10018773_30280 [Streptomyces candidus]|nr:hypothetical protein GCM10018773_30280 [Streptomyces candidus]
MAAYKRNPNWSAASTRKRPAFPIGSITSTPGPRGPAPNVIPPAKPRGEGRGYGPDRRKQLAAQQAVLEKGPVNWPVGTGHLVRMAHGSAQAFRGRITTPGNRTLDPNGNAAS